MFEAHHGQNSPAGVPLRSDSSMTLMPLASMAPGAGRCLAGRRLVDRGHVVPFLTRSASSGPIRAAVRLRDGHHLARVDPRVVTLDRGDRRESEHLEPAFSSRDRLGDRRHPEHVAADPAYPLGLGAGLVVRSGQPGVRRLHQRRVEVPGEGAQPARPAVGEVDEARALDRRRPGQVEVVADQHGLPDLRGRRASEPLALVSSGVRAARRGGGADAVDDRAGGRAPRRDGCVRPARASATPPTSYDAIVPRCPSAVGATNPGTSVIGEASDRLAERVGGRAPARARARRRPGGDRTPVSSAIRADGLLRQCPRVSVGHRLNVARRRPPARTEEVLHADGHGEGDEAERCDHGVSQCVGVRRGPGPVSELKKTAPIRACPIASPIRCPVCSTPPAVLPISGSTSISASVWFGRDHRALAAAHHEQRQRQRERRVAGRHVRRDDGQRDRADPEGDGARDHERPTDPGDHAADERCRDARCRRRTP